jgi:N-succinyldiaminopimelate aminotransferase
VLAPRLQGFGVTVVAKMSALASLTGLGTHAVGVGCRKSCSSTGGKFGSVSGPAPLLAAVHPEAVLTYAQGAPFQPDVAIGLGLPHASFTGAAVDVALRRDRLCDGLAEGSTAGLGRSERWCSAHGR